MPKSSPQQAFRARVLPPPSAPEMSFRATVDRRHPAFPWLGITPQEVEEFELGVSVDPQCLPGYLLFPVRSASNRLVGYAGRKIKASTYSYYGTAEREVFNLCEVAACPRPDRVVVVNDPMDLLFIRDYVEKTVSLLGNRHLDIQLRRLSHHLPKRPLLVLCDSTVSGRKRRQTLVQRLSPFHPVHAPEFLEDGRTIRSLNRSELEEIL